jgi:hypothetical protein
MLEALDDLPDHVIGFSNHGELHAEDYTDVLLPAIDGVLDSGGELRIVLVFERWDGMSPGGLWEDLELGLEHLTRWKKIALVTDIEWMITMTRLFGWMTPGDLKQFPLTDRVAAIEWVAS